MKRTCSGLSIVELLVVIALIGVLAALATGGVRGFLERGRLSDAISTIDRHVGDARRIAKRTDETVTLELVQAAGGGVEIRRDGVVIARIAGATLASGVGESVSFDPPFGTNGGDDVTYGITVGASTASVNIVGILGQTVVTR